jgi:hypothetical protein
MAEGTFYCTDEQEGKDLITKLMAGKDASNIKIQVVTDFSTVNQSKSKDNNIQIVRKSKIRKSKKGDIVGIYHRTPVPTRAERSSFTMGVGKQSSPSSKDGNQYLNNIDSKTEKKHLKSFNSLRATSQSVEGKDIRPAARGKGQASAMKGWNALGAAAFANHKHGKTYDVSQDWEWLHIQGAQLGGKTSEDGNNLVPGLYTTNSFMIPYENQIARWANKYQEADSSTRGDMKVDFEIEYDLAQLFAKSITISITTTNLPTLGNTGGKQKLMKFDPLNGVEMDKFGLAIRNEKKKTNRAIVLPD